MLTQLEQRLVGTLGAALGDRATVSTGSQTTGTPTAPELFVLASDLELQQDDGTASQEESRGAAFANSTVRAVADGLSKEFTVSGQGELIEVEAPPGFTLLAGTHYQCERVAGSTPAGGTNNFLVTFVSPPSAGDILMRFRGAATGGYSETSLGSISLSLIASAPRMEEADATLNVALGHTLIELSSSRHLEAALSDGVNLRMLEPKGFLQSVQRRQTPEGSSFSATAKLHVSGRVELQVSTGSREDQGTGRIKEIRVAGQP